MSHIKHKSKIPKLDLSKVPAESSSDEEEEEDESEDDEQPQKQPVDSVSSDDDPENMVQFLHTLSDDPEYGVDSDDARALDRDSI